MPQLFHRLKSLAGTFRRRVCLQTRRSASGSRRVGALAGTTARGVWGGAGTDAAIGNRSLRVDGHLHHHDQQDKAKTRKRKVEFSAFNFLNFCFEQLLSAFQISHFNWILCIPWYPFSFEPITPRNGLRIRFSRRWVKRGLGRKLLSWMTVRRIKH